MTIYCNDYNSRISTVVGSILGGQNITGDQLLI